MNRARRVAVSPFSVDLSYTVPGRTAAAIPAAWWVAHACTDFPLPKPTWPLAEWVTLFANHQLSGGPDP
jgi:hypothetical protein